MTEHQQWKVVSRETSGAPGMTVFIDAESEAAALAFFRQSFPRHEVVSLRLEPARPCSAYAKRGGG